MLSTPLLFILLPLIAALAAGLTSRRQTLSIIITSLTAFGLAVLAFFFPQDPVLEIGPLSLAFEESFGILGRQITVSHEILPFVALMFGVTGLWSLSSGLAGTPELFRPIILAAVGLMIAALGVQPFLYAALLIETAVLATIPMLTPMGKKPHTGVLRYLSLQTLAMPFILLAGWLLAGVEVLPSDSMLIRQSAFTLGLGFALWLAVFPFHAWVPMISENASPLAASFLLFILPVTILIFGLNFIDRYAWLRESEALFSILRIMGTMMVVLGGVWTAFQNNLKRVFGFSALAETGFLILAVGLHEQSGLALLLMLIPVRALGFWFWGHILTNLEIYSDSLTLEGLTGFLRKYPFLTGALLLAQFNIAGLPLLMGFPAKIALMSALTAAAPELGLWVFIGNLGLFLFTIRLLGFLIAPANHQSPSWKISERKHELIPILMVTLILLMMGIFPQIFLTGLLEIVQAFSQLQ
jgi:NADH:ubiquinone oxidoreductase subunit 2 (subunit N)